MIRPPRLPAAVRSTLAVAAAAVLAAAVQAPPASAAPPNVIFILTDDQGYGDLGCHGNTAIRTPNIDKFWAQSVRLTNFHSSPTCSPTRAAIMTGKNPLRAGVWHTISGRSILREGETTLPQLLAAAGYRTGIFGKWHLGDNFPSRPQDRGFQEVLVHGGGGVGQTPDAWGNDYIDDTFRHGDKWTPQKGYCTDVWFAAATNWIQQVKSGPFFCYIPLNAPHGPYVPPPGKLESYQNRPGVPNAAFYAMIENIDDNVGRLLAKLDELGIAQNTLVIFSTDNGTAAGTDDQGRGGFNAGMRGKKGSPYDGGHRVPCFLRWPEGKIAGGRDASVLAAHYDLFPTLLDLCGVALPGGISIDGRSLAPLLRGETVPWPDRAVIVDSQRVLHPVQWRQSAVLTSRWRLINGRELYDMQADPGQQNNVASGHRDEVARLRGEYESWWNGLKESFSKDAVILLGNDAENPSVLTAHDWLCNEGQCPWDQYGIEKGLAGNGPWSVRIDRPGTYQFTLRRWPQGVDRPMHEKFFPVEKARIHLGNWDETAAVPANAREAQFRAKLPAGPAKLQTWFLGPDGKSCGAFFVRVERLEELPESPGGKQKPKQQDKRPEGGKGKKPSQADDKPAAP